MKKINDACGYGMQLIIRAPHGGLDPNNDYKPIDVSTSTSLCSDESCAATLVPSHSLTCRNKLEQALKIIDIAALSNICYHLAAKIEDRLVRGKVQPPEIEENNNIFVCFGHNDQFRYGTYIHSSGGCKNIKIFLVRKHERNLLRQSPPFILWSCNHACIFHYSDNIGPDKWYGHAPFIPLILTVHFNF